MRKYVIFLGRHSAGKLDTARLSGILGATSITKVSDLMRLVFNSTSVEIVYSHSSIFNFLSLILLFGAKHTLVVHNPPGFSSRPGWIGVYDNLLLSLQLLLIRRRIFLSSETQKAYKNRKFDILIDDYVQPNKEIKQIKKDSKILFFGRYLDYKNVSLVYQLSKNTNYYYTIASANCPFETTPNCRVMNSYISDHEVDILFRTHDIIILPYTLVSQSGPFYLALEYGLEILCSDLEFFQSYSHLTNVHIHPNEEASYKKTLRSLFNEHY